MPNTTVRAAAEGLPAINRRSVLGGFAAATALVTADYAQAAGNPDAELFRLEAEFNSADDLVHIATGKVVKVENRIQSLIPAEPVRLPLTDDLKAAFREMLAMEDCLDHPLAPAYRKRLQENDRRQATWQAECDEITRQCGLAEAEAEQEQVEIVAGAIASSILDAPAMTAAGMLVKLRVHDRWMFDGDRILESLAADIKSMA